MEGKPVRQERKRKQTKLFDLSLKEKNISKFEITRYCNVAVQS